MLHLPFLTCCLLLLLSACGGRQTPSEDTKASSDAAASKSALEPTPEPAPGPTAEPTAGPTAEPTAAGAWFREVTNEVGLDFRHETGAAGDLLLPEIMGSGVALFDADVDGDLDVYLVNSAFDLGTSTSASAGDPRNRLYLQGPDGTFVDATEGSGLGDRGYGMGVGIGDFDKDGLPDVYVSNLGRDRLYRNLGMHQGAGTVTFEDITAGAGIEVDGWSTSVAPFDADGDGDLDLFITRYVAYDRNVKCYDTAGRHEYCGPTAFPGVSDVFLENVGPGADAPVTFKDRSQGAGIAAVAAAGLGVASEDINGDGRLDIYVANDADPNQLWTGQGGAPPTFLDEALMLGASVNALGAAEAGMGVLAADFDNDLDVDLFMTHLEHESNTFYRNLGGDLGFEDATTAWGLAASSTAFTGFGTAAFDADLDGDLDLVVANGRVFRSTRIPGELEAPWHDYAEPNLLYENVGGGRFTLREDLAGPLHRVEVSRGLAVGDVDRDGDLDLLLNNAQGPARLFLNEAPRAGHWLLVEAIDPRVGGPVLGAVVFVQAGERRWRRGIHGGASYLSSSEPVAHFGLGPATAVDEVEVQWPDGLRELFPAVAVDQRIQLRRGAGEHP